MLMFAEPEKWEGEETCPKCEKKKNNNAKITRDTQTVLFFFTPMQHSNRGKKMNK